MMNKNIIRNTLKLSSTSGRHFHSNCIRHFPASMKTLEQFKTEPYDLHLLEECIDCNTEISREQALVFFTKMNFIRKMEVAASHLYLKKAIRGFCHLYVGQEACAVGIKAVMRPHDTLITSYRCHAWPMLMDDNMEEAIKGTLKELMGKNTGK